MSSLPQKLCRDWIATHAVFMLKGISYRDNAVSPLSEIENGKRPIGKESAKEFAAISCDYWRFLYRLRMPQANF